MIRPFSVRDIVRVHRLSDPAIPLRVRHVLTENHYPLRNALVSLLWRSQYPTFIWKADKGKGAAFVQLNVGDDNTHAQIAYLGLKGLKLSSGSLILDENVVLPLLDELVAEVGRRGIHNLVAEVNESGPELTALRRAGFAVYTRQDIWVINRVEKQARQKTLRPQRPVDEWDIQLLYANTVPRLIQLVEPEPPLNRGEGWVLHDGDEMAGFVHFHDGPAACWLRLYIHPRAEAMAEEIIAAALHLKQPAAEHPLYCCLRRYQSWLQSSLVRAGFELWGSQAVMVKHTVQHATKALPDLTVALDGPAVKRATGTSPLAQRCHSN